MFGLFDKLNDPENAHRERAAFIAALALTAVIGGTWFYFLRPTESAPPVAHRATGGAATSTVETDDLDGPISNFRVEMADAAVFLASQVRKIGDLWKGWSFGKPVEFQRQEEDPKFIPLESLPSL